VKAVVLPLVIALSWLAIATSRGTPVTWGPAGSPAISGTLDATAIPLSTSMVPVLYTNVNGQGYDIVVTTSGLTQDGLTTVSGTNGWWFAGSAPGSAFATITYNFYLTGTDLPVAMQGLDLLFEDAEDEEYFGNFSYFDDFGNEVPVLFNNLNFFNYSDGGLYFDNFTEGSNNAAEEGGTQLNETVEVNLTQRTASGFTIGSHRQSSSAGSVIMMGLGDLSIAPIVSWRMSYFGPSFDTESIAGDNANPSGDGIPNLLKYAFGLDPTTSETSGLPVISAPDDFLQVNFNILSADTDITYIVETSDDLIHWKEDSTYSAAAGNKPYNGDTIQLSATPITGGTNIVVTDTMPLDVTPVRFMRVLVTRP
jgi:hypothetical protein